MRLSLVDQVRPEVPCVTLGLSLTSQDVVCYISFPCQETGNAVMGIVSQGESTDPQGVPEAPVAQVRKKTKPLSGTVFPIASPSLL